MDRISWKSFFGLALAAMVCLLAAPASAGITYNVTNYAAGQNDWSLNGTITLSGTGTFTSASAITAWDLTATKGGVNHRYSNTTTTSGSPVRLDGTLGATSTTLSLPTGSAFRFSEEATNSSYIRWANAFPSFFGTDTSYSAGRIGGGTLWFSPNFSPIAGSAWTLGTATSSAVPEIDPAGIGSVLALVTGALGLLERRRLKMA